MKILVTGATGFLGQFLCKKLSKLGNNLIKVSSATNDLMKEDSLDEFNEIKLDQIFHLAAWTQAGDFPLYHPGEQWLKNQKINTNMLSWWQKHQPQAKMIAMGTSCSYDPALPLVELNYLKGQPIDSLFAYAMTKRMLLAGLISLHKQYKLNYLYLVPSTLYGKGYHLDGRQMHFIFDLMRKILKGKFFDEEVILWGDGYQKRELVYVDDFVDIMLRLVQTENNTVINVGAGQEYSIRDFANKICAIVEYDQEKIYYDTSKYVGVKSKVLNIDRLNEIIPSLKLTDLKKGFENTINWFLDNKNKLLNG
jgi:GDP-L-fucose synthase